MTITLHSSLLKTDFGSESNIKTEIQSFYIEKERYYRYLEERKNILQTFNINKINTNLPINYYENSEKLWLEIINDEKELCYRYSVFKDKHINILHEIERITYKLSSEFLVQRDFLLTNIIKYKKIQNTKLFDKSEDYLDV
jgi:hypothetical protein